VPQLHPDSNQRPPSPRLSHGNGECRALGVPIYVYKVWLANVRSGSLARQNSPVTATPRHIFKFVAHSDTGGEATEQLSLFWLPPVPANPRVPHPRSIIQEDCPEGGAFDYGACPEIFLRRVGIGPLRVAWDTNILIDYGEIGEQIWDEDRPLDPPVRDRAHRNELFSLRDLMQVWTYRDIRIHVFPFQIDDAKKALTGERRAFRQHQVDQIAAALTCLCQGTEGWEPDNGDEAPTPCSLESMRSGPDRQLLESAVDAGCHVFLTRDAGVLAQADLLRQYWLAVLSPTELMRRLADAGELGVYGVGPVLLPDNHKCIHIMAACGWPRDGH
jgi:hypothetical protein